MDHDVELRANLRRHRGFATLLLLLMAALTLLAYALPIGWGADLLAASAKAGLVGGLADWFAVTALFRHPLGIPIPHTAIIPAQKERLGRGLGRFVANQVFTEAELQRVLRDLDLSAILRGFLNDPVATRPAARALARMLPRLLTTLEDGRARKLLGRLLPRMAGSPGAAPVVARALRALLASGRHQAVFDVAIAQLKTVLVAKEDDLKQAIAARVRDEGGALVGWIGGAYTARKILALINAELEKVEPADSALRQGFEAWIEAEITRLETDPERAVALGRAIRGALQHPAVERWLGDVWTRLRNALADDAANPNGRTVALLEAAFANAGTLLSEDPGARDRLNQGLQSILLALLPTAQARIESFIGGVVGSWNTAEITDKIELRVGRDLQFVRINGTLVGFVAGGALFLALQAMFGRVVD
ncbi:MAG: DUF445 domain-containing protein [Rubritepida sp.]|nr:DUF445 domain-containing protein [Rubritepida sp.]